jgi:hypothetical protein
MAELGKPKWFHILGPKPGSKHQNGIIGPEPFTLGFFLDFRFFDVRKTKKKIQIFLGKQDFIRENGLRIRTQHSKITLESIFLS